MARERSAPRAPASLAPAGRGFWARVFDWGYCDLTPAEMALLEQVCRTLDVVAVLDAASKADPMTSGSKGQPVVNPALSEARLQRRELARLLDQLGLPAAEDDQAVPSSATSRRARKAANSRWQREARRESGGVA